MAKFARFLRNESGATAIEYGLIAAGIAVAIIAVVQGIGTNLNTPSAVCRPPQVSASALPAAQTAESTLRVRRISAGAEFARCKRSYAEMNANRSAMIPPLD